MGKLLQSTRCTIASAVAVAVVDVFQFENVNNKPQLNLSSSGLSKYSEKKKNT